MRFQLCHVFLLLSHISFFISPRIVSAQCHEDQKNALLQIFSDYSALPSWTSNNSDCCLWYGITCDNTTGLVISLDVSDCSISSRINSTNLASLSSLQSLNLSYNYFNFSIPPDLDSLSNLTHLNLSHAGFTGQIPPAIGHLRNLVSLDISAFFSHLELKDPSIEKLLRNLSGLTKLHLDGVNISSAVPEFLSDFTNLTSLRLRSCELQGEFPAKIFQLPKLEVLDVSGNTFLNGSFPAELPPENALQTLVLSYTRFSGEFPYSFGNLRHLIKLQIRGCEFSGQIPYSMRNIGGLVHLDLSSNRFNGSIPSLDNLSNLTYLDLSWNAFSGPIPSLFTLPSLRALDLGQNQLAGQLDEFTNASRTLQAVSLNNNQLQGQIPHSLFDLAGLMILDLSSNKFNGTVQLAMLQNLKNLSYLDLSDNYLSVNTHGTNYSFPQLGVLYLGSCNLTEFPEFLKNQSMMLYLDLSNNNIYGKMPKWVWEIGNGYLNSLNLSHNLLTSLEEPGNLSSIDMLFALDIHSNQLRGSIPLPPPGIIVLDYSYNRFTSAIPSNFSNSLERAIFFSISGNKIVGEIPPSICNAKNLQVLDLSNNNLNGSITECLIERSNRLSILNLRNNRFTGIIPEISSVSCSLRTLDLYGNRLEGQLPRSLAKCRDLEVLDVGNNQINGPFPYHLDTLSKLRVLVLRSNRFNGSILWPHNRSFPMLQIIDLSANGFSGNMPQHFFQSLHAMMSGKEDEDPGLYDQIIRFTLDSLYYQDTVTITSKGQYMELVKILTIFTSIDLSNNHFVGEIPKVIGDLKSLHILNLSRNGFTGPIPASLGNMTQLESLDLSQNNLSEEIPQQLLSLTFLEVLNLSYNQLVGSIPFANQFSTFNNDTYIGNPRLCGPPLTRKCGLPPSTPDGVDSQSTGHVNWQLISIQLGYIAGIGAVYGPLIFWKKWRWWYFKKVDMMLAYFHDRCNIF